MPIDYSELIIDRRESPSQALGKQSRLSRLYPVFYAFVRSIGCVYTVVANVGEGQTILSNLWHKLRAAAVNFKIGTNVADNSQN